ncbi:heparan-alpha-glucosaminide N-acetyltransferase-like [Diprion similis]|uniref:heparan-alpha-glucosaminide N-acetyltransferase-like n=1 Tax=Diprion similis TaxID=362088 RepID=UPI001EF91ABE|nr:heparan-alpha-glucosaminide N-acetyltransferase-like [Diprion similis]XP_046753943.1 heparan-alpha-glucosaminide N-acetyltransferase-like [Diprion similis]
MTENTYCEYEDLTYDTACVVVKTSTDYPETWLYSLSSDCHLCPYTRIGQITYAQNQSFTFQTERSLTWRVRSNGIEEYVPASNTSDIICSLVPNLGQFGVYEFDVNNGSCILSIVKDPSSLYIPLLAVFLVTLCLLAGCALLRTGINNLRKKFKDQNPSVGAADAQEKTSVVKRRVRSIDTFRGISILAMIFVNDGAGGYSVLEHATWDGLLVGDLVFPWFMWIMGVCLPISVGSQLSRQVSRLTMCGATIKRSAILFLLGLSLNTLGTNAQLENIRLFGVLQRFSVVYLIVALILVILNRRRRIEPKNPFLEAVSDIFVLLPQWVLVLCLVAAHSAITFRLPVPGCPTGYLGPGGRHDDAKYPDCVGGAAGYVDRKILGTQHIYQYPTANTVYGSGPFDPEGILGCLSSVFQVFLGVQAGMILKYYTSWKGRVCRWMGWALICGAVGLALHFTNIVPINKNLWSMSFVLVTTSLAFLLLTICYVLVDVMEFWRGGPFRIPGMNALAMYVGHQLCYQIFPFHWAYGEMNTHTWRLIEAIWGVGLWTVIAYFLHRRKIYLTL